MQMIRKFFILSVVLILCSNIVLAMGSKVRPGTIGVTVSIPPLAEFVEKVGGNYVSVSVMVPPGSSPHQYEPTPRQMQKLRLAKVFIKVGSGIEFELTWLDKILAINPHLQICNCAKNIEFLTHNEEEEAPEHHHEEAQDHDDNEQQHQHRTDPHIWLSPYNAIQMVNNIKDSLIQIDPVHKDSYKLNAKKYITELQQLRNEIKKEFTHLNQHKFIVFHPAWSYFAKDFGLEQIPIAKEGKEPSAKGLTYLINFARKENIRIIFASPQFSQKSAQVIANELGGAVVLIDPLSRNYISNLQKISKILVNQRK